MCEIRFWLCKGFNSIGFLGTLIVVVLAAIKLDVKDSLSDFLFQSLSDTLIEEEVIIQFKALIITAKS